MTGNPLAHHLSFAVSIQVKMNLKLMAYLLRYEVWASWNVPATAIILNLIFTVKMH